MPDLACASGSVVETDLTIVLIQMRCPHLREAFTEIVTGTSSRVFSADLPLPSRRRFVAEVSLASKQKEQPGVKLIRAGKGRRLRCAVDREISAAGNLMPGWSRLRFNPSGAE